MTIELACGPMDTPTFLAEIPFVCSLFHIPGLTQVSILYGWACAEDHLWKRLELPPLDLFGFVSQSIQDGIYRPATSDLFITAPDHLEAHLCHESDIHIQTASPTMVRQCATRWLSQNQRILRKEPPNTWRQIPSVEEATLGL